jgi:hypothetical protein
MNFLIFPQARHYGRKNNKNTKQKYFGKACALFLAAQKSKYLRNISKMFLKFVIRNYKLAIVFRIRRENRYI